MSDIERRAMLGVVGIGALAALAKTSGAGPIDPPMGPVAPTGRTLDEVFDKIPGGGSGDGRTAIPGGTSTVAINQAGSYVLTGNIAVPSGFNGIDISAGGVTLDLNGYAVTSAAATGTGINFANSLSRVSVRNGTVNGFNVGIALGSGIGMLLEDLLVMNAKVTGVWCNFSGSRAIHMRRCRVVDTGSPTTSLEGNLSISGIFLGGGMHLVEDCAVHRVINNGVGSGTLRGIYVSSAATTVKGNIVQRCVVTAEAAVAGFGISFANSTAGVYRDCTVQFFNTNYNLGTDGGGNV